MYPKIHGYDDLTYVKEHVRDAEIVVGIPSRNTAHIIGYVVRNVDLGLSKYYPEAKATIIVCDGLSNDSTVDVVRAIKKDVNNELLLVPNILSRGKGGALKTIIDIVSRYSSAKALLFVDSDLRSITPEWIPLLVRGALECDYATPLYIRHKFDATITNFIARPLTTMAYGIDIKQPIGGDFGLSRELVNILSQDILWEANPWSYLFGVDIFITHTALANGIQVCETLLKAKIHEAKDPAKNLKNMFTEVTGSLFTSLIEYSYAWTKKHIDKIVNPKVICKPEPPSMYPWEVKVDVDRALRVFKEGLEVNKDLYIKIMPKELLNKIQNSNDGIDSRTWGEILLHSFNYFVKEPRYLKKKTLLESLFYLWQGRLYNYYVNALDLSNEEAELLVYKDVELLFSLRERFVEILASLN